MSKGQNAKKGSKKEPLKTMKEKKAAKRGKKNEKLNRGGQLPMNSQLLNSSGVLLAF